MRARDYSLNMINKAVSIVCGLIISVIVARYLGVVLRGELAFISQTGSLIAIVLGLGVGQAFIRFFKLDPTAETYAATLSVLLIQVAGFAAFGAVVGALTNLETGWWLIAVAVSTAGFQQVEAVMAAYDIALKMRVHMAYSILRLLAHVVMLFLPHAGLLLPLSITVISAASTLLAYVVLAPRPKLRIPSGVFVKDLLGFGFLPMLTSVLIVLNYNVDVLMLRMFGVSHDLGLYAVAAGVTTYLWVVPDAIKEVLLSIIVRSADPKRVLLPLKAAVFASLVCVIGFAASGWFLVPVLFGDDFAGSYILIVILSVGVVPMVYYKILGAVVLGEGKRWFYFGCLSVAVVANIAFNALVIPAFGAVGAAWVSVGAYWLTGFGFLSYYSRLAKCTAGELLLLSPRERGLVRGLVPLLRTRKGGG